MNSEGCGHHAERLLVIKCSETVVGLEILDRLSTGLVLKPSLSRCLPSVMYCFMQQLCCTM